MTQPFGSCDILFSASLALAAPATNVATAPKQVASSNLRITKPPTLFQVYFFALGSDCPAATLDTDSISESRYTFSSRYPLSALKGRQPFQRTEVQLKPETIKCYARHPERATEIKSATVCLVLRCNSSSACAGSARNIDL